MFTQSEITYIVSLLKRKKEIEGHKNLLLDGIDKEIEKGEFKYVHLNYIYNTLYKIVGFSNIDVDKEILYFIFPHLLKKHQLNWVRTNIYDLDSIQSLSISDALFAATTYEEFSILLYIQSQKNNTSIFIDDHMIDILSDLYKHKFPDGYNVLKQIKK